MAKKERSNKELRFSRPALIVSCVSWGRPLSSLAAVPLITVAVLAYDYLVFWLANHFHQEMVTTATTVLGEAGLISLFSILLVVFWSVCSSIILKIKLLKTGFFRRFATFLLPQTIVMLAVLFVFNTEYEHHRYTSLFFALILLGLLAFDGLIAKKQIKEKSLLATICRWWMLPLCLACMILLNSWDQIFFRFAGLHISGFHRLLSLLIVCALAFIGYRVFVLSRLHFLNVRVKVILSVVGLIVAIAGTAVVSVSPLARSSIVLNLRCEEAMGVLFSPAIFGRSFNLGRLPAENPPSLETYLIEKEISPEINFGLPKNIWIVVIDTLRADFFSCDDENGFPPSHRNKFSCFSNAISPANTTHYAIPSFLEGRFARPDSEFTLVAKELPLRGYTVTGAAPLKNIDRYIGFDARTELKKTQPYPPKWNRVNDLSKRNLLKLDRSKPFFFFTHYFDVHLPSWWPPHMFEVGKEWATKHYGVSVKQASDGLHDLFGFMDEQGLWENTVVIVTADHGEDLYEKGFYAHAYTMSQANLAVPLYIHLPGEPTKDIDTMVSNLDIGGTVAAIAGVSDKPIDGKSLLHHIRSVEANDETRWIFSMSGGSEKFAVFHAGYKYVWDRERLTHELYRLDNDPEELSNLISSEYVFAREMSRALSAFVKEKVAFHAPGVLMTAMTKQK